MPTDLAIRPATTDDAPAIAAIYNHYITDTIVTFEEDPVSTDEIARRMRDVAAAGLPWLAAERDGRILGYCYSGKWSTRIGYRFSVEVTVYLDPHSGGMGLGTSLYGAMFPLLKALGIRNVIGGIALPNIASVALHEKFGMKQVAHYKDIGVKFGQWLDVGYWQGTL